MGCPPKAEMTRSSGKQPAERTAVRAAPTLAQIGTCRPMDFLPASVPEGFQRASGKPFGASAGAYPCPGWGLTRRLRRGSGRAVLWVSRQLRCPKVSKGRAESPLHASSCAKFVVRSFLPRGMTRRLRRGSRACSPMGRPHFSFGGERKVCKRKPAARRLREKAFYCPFLKEGVRNVARNIVG